MPCHRRYVWEHRPADPLDAGRLAAEATRVLLTACEDRPQFFSAPDVTGSRFGILRFSITISSKDLWRCAWRARRLLAEIQLATAVPLRLISQVAVVKREPHRHPNRAARWRGKVASDG